MTEEKESQCIHSVLDAVIKEKSTGAHHVTTGASLPPAVSKWQAILSVWEEVRYTCLLIEIKKNSRACLSFCEFKGTTFASDFWTLETGGCSMRDADLDNQRGGKLERRQGYRETKSKSQRELFFFPLVI